MGVTKTDLFTTAQNDLAQIAKVFTHPARIAIIQYLLTAKACINGNLVRELGLAQATISQHLRERVSVCYCINPERWIEIRNLFNQLFSQYPPPSKGDCC